MKQSKNLKNIPLTGANFLGIIVLTLIILSTSGYAEISPLKTGTLTMEFHDEKLTAVINTVPLSQVIKEFSRSTGVEVLWQGRASERMIGMRFIDLSPDEAVQRILRRENHILYYTSSKGKNKLEKILIVSCKEVREEPRYTSETFLEPRLLAMAEPEDELEELHAIEPVPFDEEELTDAIEQLLSQGDTESAEALMDAFADE